MNAVIPPPEPSALFAEAAAIEMSTTPSTRTDAVEPTLLSVVTASLLDASRIVPPLAERAPTVTIEPLPRAIIPGITARAILSNVVTLIEIIEARLSSLSSWTAGPMSKPPAR